MKRAILILLNLLAVIPVMAGRRDAGSLKPDAGLLLGMMRSEMLRHPQAWTIDRQKKPKWNYTQGLELMAMTDAADFLEEDGHGPLHREVYAFALTYADTLVQPDGSIMGHKMENYSLDEVNSGKILYRLWQWTGGQKYRLAMDSLREQLRLSPRVPEGGFWHKKRYPQQMWLDGLYMGAPYYAEYATRFEKDAAREASYRDVWHQFALCFRQTWCEDCQLLHHAWDSSHERQWCDPETGRSRHAWGRAEGWYLMALVDCADWLPTDYRDSIAGQMLPVLETLLRLQDRRNGCWQQVLDQTGREGNYYEMSCTSMFAYAMLKGYRLGLLDKRYLKAGRRALEGICRNFVSLDEQGLWSLHSVCSVAGLSDPDRPGTFEYYISEPVIDNDPKGVGPFMKAIVEYLRTK